MAMTGTVPQKVTRPLALSASGEGAHVETISGTLTMAKTAEQFQVIDGGAGNRDVILPVAGPEFKGVFYVIRNSGGTNTLVVKDVAATVVTIAFGKGAVLVCNGANWILALDAA